MTVAYVAQTRDHLLMLDEEGVCLHVRRRSKDRGDDAVDGAIRCIGAQYVAALDPKEPGFLAHAPTLGVPMLFAKVGTNGKISIVRTGPLERFELQQNAVPERPAAKTGAAALVDARVLSPTIQFLPEPEDEPTHRMLRTVALHSVRTRVA